MAGWLIEATGFAAAGATAATFYCKRMRNLRTCALIANGLFIIYGAALALMPVLLLHCLLLPLNAFRLRESMRRTCGETPDPPPDAPSPARTGQIIG